MLRVTALEKNLPDEVRRIAREHPFVAIVGATALGFYLGRNHGRAILTALIGLGISAGSANARRMLGLAPAQKR